jgi:hypothetical protein
MMGLRNTGAEEHKIFHLVTIAAAGSACVSVIRQEYCSLDRLVELFLAITKGCSIPVLISSLTHLADVGVKAYASDLASANAKLGRIFQGGIVVLPGLIFWPVSINDPMITRALADIFLWSVTCNSLIKGGGGPVLSGCFSKLCDLLIEKGSGDAQNLYSVRLRLPKNLNTSEVARWESGGLTGLKNGVDPPLPTEVTKVINLALSEIQKAFGCPPHLVSGLYGDKKIKTSFSKKVVVAGASHAKHLVELFKEKGWDACRVKTPGWRATTLLVNRMIEDIKLAVAGIEPENTVIILAMTDNAFFMARPEDGIPVQHKRGQDNIYHVEGDIICAPI